MLAQTMLVNALSNGFTQCVQPNPGSLPLGLGLVLAVPRCRSNERLLEAGVLVLVAEGLALVGECVERCAHLHGERGERRS